MTTFSYLRRSGLVLLVLSAVACSREEDDGITAVSESDVISRVPGASIASPNAKPGATYLSARSVDLLAEVGALPDDVAALAYRVDGIIANQPADGRYSVAELLQIEKPGFIETLFPAEKAALPTLWSMLETTNDAPANVVVATSAPFKATDLSVLPGTLAKPASLVIASLPSALRDSCTRLQLTRDSDTDPTTVTEADLDGAIATPGPYTPADIKAFEATKVLFIEKATSTLAARVDVPAPFRTTKTVATFGAVKLVATESLEYGERRSATFFSAHGTGSGSISVQLEARTEGSVAFETPGNQKVVILEEATEHEQIANAGPLTLSGGTATIEVWSNGTRLGSFRATLPAAEPKSDRVDLSQFADHAFVAGGASLVRSVVEAKQEYKSWWNRHFGSESSVSNWASFTYDVAAVAPTGEVNQQALAALATPRFGVLPGRYEVPIANVGAVRFDLYPEGVLRITHPNGQSERASLYAWNNVTKFTGNVGDLRIIYDGQTMSISKNSSVLFEGPLTAAHRKA